MEHLAVNHDDMVSAEVERTHNKRGEYRVIFRDLDADAVVATRFFKTRAAAIAYADAAVGKVAA
jgi:hypothetical protein